MRLRFNYFHMNPDSLEDSIADVCSGLGYPITTFVSLWSKVDGPFYAEPD